MSKAKQPAKQTTSDKSETNKAKREMVKDILKDNPSMSAPEIGEKLVKAGYDVDPKAKAFGVYVSNQRKALKGGNGASTSKSKTTSILDQLGKARELADLVGGVGNAVKVLDFAKKQDLAELSKALEKWQKVVAEVGEENASKTIAALQEV